VTDVTEFRPSARRFHASVEWDGRTIPGDIRAGLVARDTEVIEVREGGDPGSTMKVPGRTKWEAITLERGLTEDPSFRDWADLVQDDQALGMRKNVTVHVLGKKGGQPRVSYLFVRCWPSRYVAAGAAPPGPRSEDEGELVEQLTLETEGWTRL
jgi:phage tail-like protein